MFNSILDVCMLLCFSNYMFICVYVCVLLYAYATMMKANKPETVHHVVSDCLQLDIIWLIAS